jgi:pyruvate/2-oxoglutarate/acetoin dehydrogenase E1 component
MSRQIKFFEAINEAMHIAMEMDSSVICYGLGVNDPKAIFGTTSNLQSVFGASRVFDMPTSENAMTGVAIGASLNGIKPVMVHQRLDFFLLAMDQLVNAAAKWHYMFGNQISVPITIRLILGRGWGQGPTHSQNLQAWFAHIPGLKVVMPTTPESAKGLLLASIFDPNPVVFLEHRWLHNSIGTVPEGDIRYAIGPIRTARFGTDFTIVASSYMVVEALHAAKYLETEGIECEVVDLNTVNPIDWEGIYSSVEKTGRLIALDTGYATCSISAEIIARVSMNRMSKLKCAPVRLAMPDIPEPTSFGLTIGFFIRAAEIASTAMNMLGKDGNRARLSLREPIPHDIPGAWFTGPF